MRTVMVVVMALLLCSGAMAQGKSGNKSGGSLPGCVPSGNTPKKCDGGSTGGNGGSGGSGGQGGAGGSSSSISGVTSTNTNQNVNTNQNSNSSNSNSSAQGGSVKNSGNSSSTSSATGGTGIGIGGSSTATGGQVKDSGNSQNTNTNTAQGGQGGSARQGQQQGQQQSSTSSASNGAQSNSQVVNDNQVHQAPAVFAPEAYPTAPCRVGMSGGGSGPLGGISIGGSKEDKDCSARELARSFHSLGQDTAALEVLCSTKAAERAKPTVCQGLKK